MTVRIATISAPINKIRKVFTPMTAMVVDFVLRYFLSSMADYSAARSLIKAYLLTASIETVVFYPFARPTSVPREISVVFLVNAFSLPLVWFVIPLLVPYYSAYVIGSELFAILSEAILLKAILHLSFKRVILGSALMNLTSFSVGLLLPSLIAP